MKQCISYTLGILFSFCLIFILLITSVEAVTYWNPGYYEKEYTKYQVLDDLPEMTMEDLLKVTDEMMQYLRGNREDLHVFTTMGGVEREFFTQREIAHMEDVQGLFLGGIFLRRASFVICILCIAAMAFLKTSVREILPKTICIGTGLFFGIAAVLGGIISTDFTKYFIIFHHIFFDNDLWILDPSVDMLINIVPEPFFMDTAARIIILFAVSVLLVFGISFWFYKKQKKHNGELL